MLQYGVLMLVFHRGICPLRGAISTLAFIDSLIEYLIFRTTILLFIKLSALLSEYSRFPQRHGHCKTGGPPVQAVRAP